MGNGRVGRNSSRLRTKIEPKVPVAELLCKETHFNNL